MVGKTTTISCLTGMIEPTAGEALIFGHLLTKNISSIRRLTGLW
jgi:ABC-type multidrug transport system ATPase subunit